METISVKTLDGGNWVRVSKSEFLKKSANAKISAQDDSIVVNGTEVRASSAQLAENCSDPVETVNSSVTPNALVLAAAAGYTIVGGGPYAYVKGASVAVDILESNTGAATVNMAGAGLIPILKNGAPLIAGDLKGGYKMKLDFDAAGHASVTTDATIAAAKSAIALGKGVNFGPGAITNLTIVHGIITDAS